MGISEVMQGNLEVSHRCSGFEPLWVHGAHPDKSNDNKVAAQPAGAAPIPPGNDIDAPRDQPSNRVGSHLVHTHSYPGKLALSLEPETRAAALAEFDHDLAAWQAAKERC